VWDDRRAQAQLHPFRRQSDRPVIVPAGLPAA
jgi:hypothetical protein